ncbi:MAG: type II toxin-antitoxin system RelE/ParE family toxin [Coriobacteriia bacterium]|nr:type II toxin-antitoxin system RelE/ParE family toxin [Coriobacteriia bacterium]
MTDKHCEVGFAKSAEDDLLGILEWYAAQLVPEVGSRLVAAIVEHVEQLEQYPDSGRMVPEFGTPSLRELLLDPYRIVYRHDGDMVSIVRVWRSERLMEDSGLSGSGT